MLQLSCKGPVKVETMSLRHEMWYINDLEFLHVTAVP
jgi:hypothetical protein